MKKILTILLCLLSIPALASAQKYILVLNKSGDTAWQLDAGTGRKIAEYSTRTGPHEVAISPDRSRAAVTNYGAQKPGSSISVIDLENRETEKVIDLKPYQRPHGIQWFSDGNRLAVTVEAQQAVAIVDVSRGEVTRILKTNKNGSHMLELSRNEKQVYVPNRDSGTLDVLGTGKGDIVNTVPTGAGAEGITLSDDGTDIWVTNRDANTISVIDSRSLEITHTLQSGQFPIRAEASPNGKWIAVSNAQSGEVSIFDSASKKQLNKISTFTTDGENGVPLGLVFSTDSQRLYVSNSEANQIVVVDTGVWEIIDRFETGATPDGIAYFETR